MNLQQWQIWKCRPPGFARDHWLVLLSGQERLDNPQRLQVNGLACYKLQGESLCFFPERHPTVRRRPGVRRLVVRKYFKVFYRVQHETRTVEVLRCWDGRREFDPVL